MALAISIHITKHAHERLKQRLGLPKSARKRHLGRVLLMGKRYTLKRGRIKTYCDKLRRTKEQVTPYFYGKYVYLFHKTTLITVFPMPHDLEDHVVTLH